MLPLGMVNLVVVAVLTELLHPQVLGRQLGDALGPWLPLVICLIGWVVAVVAWLVVTLGGPVRERQPARGDDQANTSRSSQTMRPDDPDIRWIEEPKLGLAGKSVPAAVAQG